MAVRTTGAPRGSTTKTLAAGRAPSSDGHHAGLSCPVLHVAARRVLCLSYGTLSTVASACPPLPHLMFLSMLSHTN